jgi:hypothetical protein
MKAEPPTATPTQLQESSAAPLPHRGMPHPGAPPASTSARCLRRWPALLALTVTGVLFALVIVEVCARIVSGNWTDSFLERQLGWIRGAYPVSYDAELGWIPRAGFSSSRNIWRTQVTITQDNLRTNGPGPRPQGGRPVLAIGDSFTFGDEVADAQTWPAHLERLSGRPVLNAGVFGYGVDQMVLRARKLVTTVQPEWVIVSLIPHDVVRCELSVFGAAKPYFQLEGGELRPSNQPVPPPQPVARDAFRRIFGHSFVAHTIMRNVAGSYWLRGRRKTVRAHHDGEAVAIRLLRSLAQDLDARGVRLLVVAQGVRELPPADMGLAARVLKGLERSPALILDLHGPLAELRERDAERFAGFYRLHMTDSGNAFLAERIADAIRKAGPAS